MAKRIQAAQTPESPTTIEASWGLARFSISSPRAMVAFGLFALAALACVTYVVVKSLLRDPVPTTTAPTAVTTITAPASPTSARAANPAPASTTPVAMVQATTSTDVEQVTSRPNSINEFSRRVDSKVHVRQIRQKSTGDHSRNSVVL